jgi:hypothetical protein
MDKVKLLFLGNGAFLLLSALFFLWLWNRKKKETFFRDDLWQREWDAKNEGAGLNSAKAASVDQKILLDYKEEESSSPRPKEAKKASTKGPGPSLSSEFRVPNFKGRPHEVLGVSLHATVDQVRRAHKHWIKRYHPDRVTHLGASYVEQARLRAEQLNAARDRLLPKGSVKP